jgi:hypothetical protein
VGPPTDIEIPYYLQLRRLNSLHQILVDKFYTLLMEVALIPEAVKIIL